MRDCRNPVTDKYESDLTKDTDQPRSSPRSNFGPRRAGKLGGNNIKITLVTRIDSGKWKTVRRMRDRLVNKDRKTPLVIDSEANEHVVNNLRLFRKRLRIRPVTLNLADGSVIKVEYKSPREVYVFGINMVLSTVYYIPTLQLNKMSCSRLD